MSKDYIVAAANDGSNGVTELTIGFEMRMIQDALRRAAEELVDLPDQTSEHAKALTRAIVVFLNRIPEARLETLADLTATLFLHAATHKLQSLLECLARKHVSELLPVKPLIDDEFIRAIVDNRPCHLRRLLRYSRVGNGSVLLRRAAYHGRLDCMNVLFDVGISPEVAVDNVKTALHFAVCGRQPDAIRLLIQHKADVNICDGDDYTPLQYAICNDAPECVILLVDASRDCQDGIRHYSKMLSMALALRRTECVRALLQGNADVNVPFNGSFPIHIAVRVASEELISILCAKGADLDQRDQRGDTALSLAKSPEIAASLLLRGASPVSALESIRRLDRSMKPKVLKLLHRWSTVASTTTTTSSSLKREGRNSLDSERSSKKN